MLHGTWRQNITRRPHVNSPCLLLRNGAVLHGQAWWQERIDRLRAVEGGKHEKYTTERAMSCGANPVKERAAVLYDAFGDLDQVYSKWIGWGRAGADERPPVYPGIDAPDALGDVQVALERAREAAAEGGGQRKFVLLQIGSNKYK